MKKKKILKVLVTLVCVFGLLTLMTLTVGADEAKSEAVKSDAGTDAWTNVMNFIIPWIGRLGGAVMLIGGIMFGLAFKNDDADGKTRGIQTLIAGAIVVAVGVSSNIFLG